MSFQKFNPIEYLGGQYHQYLSGWTQGFLLINDEDVMSVIKQLFEEVSKKSSEPMYCIAYSKIKDQNVLLWVDPTSKELNSTPLNELDGYKDIMVEGTLRTTVRNFLQKKEISPDRKQYFQINKHKPRYLEIRSEQQKREIERRREVMGARSQVMVKSLSDLTTGVDVIKGQKLYSELTGIPLADIGDFVTKSYKELKGLLVATARPAYGIRYNANGQRNELYWMKTTDTELQVKPLDAALMVKDSRGAEYSVENYLSQTKGISKDKFLDPITEKRNAAAASTSGSSADVLPPVVISTTTTTTSSTPLPPSLTPLDIDVRDGQDINKALRRVISANIEETQREVLIDAIVDRHKINDFKYNDPNSVSLKRAVMGKQSYAAAKIVGMFEDKEEAIGKLVTKINETIPNSKIENDYFIEKSVEEVMKKLDEIFEGVPLTRSDATTRLPGGSSTSITAASTLRGGDGSGGDTSSTQDEDLGPRPGQT